VRFIDIMANGGLAQRQLDRERERAAREAAIEGGFVDALGAAGNSLVGGSFGALKDIGKRKATQAEAAADETIAQHLADVGDANEGPPREGEGPSYRDTAGDVARRATQSLDAKPVGFLDRIGSALIGEDSAKAIAKARAEKAVAANVMENRRTARADTIAAQQANVAASNRDFERERQRKVDEATKGKADVTTAIGFLPHIVAAGIENADDPDTIAARVAAMPTFAALPHDVLHDLVVAETQKQKRARIAADNKADLDAQTAQALAAERQARATKAARGAAPQSPGVPSLKDQLTQARIDALNAKTAAGAGGGKKPAGGGKLNLDAMALEVQHANALADLYEGGDINPLGGKMPAAMKGSARINAEQLAHSLALGVPSAFSGTTRLNTVELQSALHDIIGSPDTVDTNAHKAQRARELARMLQATVDALKGQPAAAASTAVPTSGGNEARAAAVYRAMTPEQQNAVRALIASGLDRVAAVARVTGGH
jgi:hypothetical protein